MVTRHKIRKCGLRWAPEFILLTPPTTQDEALGRSTFYFNHLISNVNSLESLLIAGDDHAFSVYFHDGYGNVDIATGTSLSQTIFTYPYPSDLLEHSLQQFIKISDSVNVQFEVVNSADHADISFYYDSEIVLDHSHDHNLGLTIFFSDYIYSLIYISCCFWMESYDICTSICKIFYEIINR